MAALRGRQRPGLRVTAMKQGPSHPARPAALPLPLIVFHGDLDTTVAPANAARLIDHVLAAGSPGAVPTAVTTGGQVPGGHAYTRTCYQDPAGATLAERWTIHQAGHAWSGGVPHRSYTDPTGPSQRRVHPLLRASTPPDQPADLEAPGPYQNTDRGPAQLLRPLARCPTPGGRRDSWNMPASGRSQNRPGKPVHPQSRIGGATSFGLDDAWPVKLVFPLAGRTPRPSRAKCGIRSREGVLPGESQRHGEGQLVRVGFRQSGFGLVRQELLHFGLDALLDNAPPTRVALQ